MLAVMGLVPKTLQATVDAAVNTGNNMGIPTEEFVDTIQWMEEELQDELGDEKAGIFLDLPDKNVFYTLNPREPKFFPLSISAMAKVFYAAGEEWTLSSKYYDVTNYGYFNGNTEEATQIARNLYDEIHRLHGKRLVLGECGHGARAMRWEGPNDLKTCLLYTARKNLMSSTPLNCALNAFNLALKDSAEALVLLLLKKFNILLEWANPEDATELKE